MFLVLYLYSSHDFNCCANSSVSIRILSVLVLVYSPRKNAVGGSFSKLISHNLIERQEFKIVWISLLSKASFSARTTLGILTLNLNFLGDISTSKVSKKLLT